MSVFVSPFRKIVEDVMLEMRDNSIQVAPTTGVITVSAANLKKFKRRVNDIYCREIPSKFEHDWLRSVSYITLQASYNTGTVAVTNLSSTVTGTGTTWTSAMTGMKFTIASTNEIYTFTYVSATSGTISPVYQGATNGSTSYSIFQDTYELASDYARTTTEPGFFYDYSTGRSQLQWFSDWKWYRYYTTQVNQFPVSFRECPTLSTNGLPQVQIMPPVTTSRLVGYEYIKALPEMRDFSTGTASSTAASKTVTTLADYSASISAGQYFRVDVDGTWDKITAVSGTTLTLQDNYPTTNTTVNYTVSDAPQMPYTMQEGLFYGACHLTALEQGDKASMQGYLAAFLRSMDLDMARRNRKRYGRQYIRLGGPGR